MGALRSSFRLISFLAILVLLPAAAVLSQEGERSAADYTVDMVLEDFDAAWTALSEEYVDEGFGGLDWDEIKKEYRAKVEEAEDAESAYIAIAEMVQSGWWTSDDSAGLRCGAADPYTQGFSPTTSPSGGHPGAGLRDCLG